MSVYVRVYAAFGVEIPASLLLQVEQRATFDGIPVNDWIVLALMERISSCLEMRGVPAPYTDLVGPGHN